MTSIDMLGASVTFMKMTDRLRELLDAKSEAPAFPVSGRVEKVPYREIAVHRPEKLQEIGCAANKRADGIIRDDRVTLDNMIYIVDKMSDCIIRNEIPFCELDAHAGDGDFGMSVAKGFKRLRREWDDIMTDHTADIGDFLDACSMVIMEHCGGASGPIWGSAFRAAGRSAGGKRELSIHDFAEMMQAAVLGIQKTGERSFGRGAQVGDKTLIDALVPCADTWKACAEEGADIKSTFSRAAKAAAKGAEATEAIVARMGRAGTVGERSIGHPDAGAYALGVIFSEIAESLR